MKATFAKFCLALSLVITALAAGPARVAIAKDPATKEASSTAISPQSAVVAAKPWPHAASDLKADPSAVWGQLDNGLRYVILPNRHAPGRASLQMYINAGSLFETDETRGLAHFLEHMAFNGTKNFPDGAIEYFERLGMSFGAHTNAMTFFNFTNYTLELPKANEELTGQGMRLFRDFLDGMLLSEKEIEKERGVILSEALTRNSTEFRAAVGQIAFLLPDTLAPKRLPIGTAECVKKMTREDFVEFYEKWYTPGRTTIVAVGDFDIKMVERLIKESFASAKAKRGEQPDPANGKVLAGDAPSARLQTAKDAKSVTITLSSVRPSVKRDDTYAVWREKSVLNAAYTVLNNRFQKLAAAEDSPLQSASGSRVPLMFMAQQDSITATCQPDKWTASLNVVEQELRRAVEHGFTDTEFAEGLAELLAQMQTAADQADTRQGASLASTIVLSLIQNQVFVHPSDALEAAKKIVADLNKEECEKALRAAWDVKDVKILVQGPLTLEGDSSAKILAAYSASQKIAVTKPVESAAAKLAYTDFGPAGKIVARKEHKDLDFVEAKFENNVRINVKRSKYEKNNIRIIVRIGGGLLELPADKAGLQLLASGSFIRGGLVAHSAAEVNRIIADKHMDVNFAVDNDAFQFGGYCVPSSLEMELQLISAFITAPGYRPEARKQYLENLEGMYAVLNHTVEGVMGSKVFSLLRSGDARFSIPGREAMHKLTLADLKAWLAKPLAEGYLEVAIVGDIDPDQALELAGKTLGALPKRAESKPAFVKEREVKFPKLTKPEDIAYAAEAPRAASFVAWPITDNSITRERRLNALATVLNDRLRLKVREELGATYSPESGLFTTQVFPNYGFVYSALVLEPKQLAEIGPLVVSIGADLAKGKITDDEFDRAMKPILANLDDLDNHYWAGVLSMCQEQPVVLDWARGRKADYQAITKAEVEALAREVLSRDKAALINVLPTVPAEKAGGEQAGK